MPICILAVQWLACWTVTRAIGVRAQAKANHSISSFLNNIQYISDESSAELVLYLCK